MVNINKKKQTRSKPSVKGWLAVLNLISILLIAAFGFFGYKVIAEMTPKQTLDSSAVSNPDDLRLSDPKRIDIPAIDVSGHIVPLGLDNNRKISVPDDPDNAGWYKPGPEPGENGRAVIVGHYDSEKGPALFYKLGNLQPGDRIIIVKNDGSKIFFTVDRKASYNQNNFPTDLIYGDSETPELRVITCSGKYDRRTGLYTQNLVVFASYEKNIK
ncbi:MAG TPA: class F sortase [Verrucomicrobiae bacterium]|nr:class F sortase [Verrucomicrobiae bacterium]